MIAGFVVAGLGLVGVVVRSRRHPVPAVDLAVLGVPTVGVAALAMVAFTTGFAGMLVVNVLYLTGTWGWSPQAAGLGLAAGPLVVVVVSRLAGHLSARLGVGLVAALGALCFAAGPAWWLLHLGLESDYPVGMLPGQLLTGLGVGLILPTLSSVVGSALPAHQWGSGSSLINTARQVGSVLGVALLVSVIGVHTTGRPSELGSVRAGWVLMAASALVAAVAGLALAAVERGRARRTGPDAAEPDAPEPDAPEPVAAVRGTVHDPAGRPIAGAMATVMTAGGRQLGKVATGVDGRFVVRVDPERAGTQVITLVSAPEHRPEAYRVPLGTDVASELARRSVAAPA